MEPKLGAWFRSETTRAPVDPTADDESKRLIGHLVYKFKPRKDTHVPNPSGLPWIAYMTDSIRHPPTTDPLHASERVKKVKPISPIGKGPDSSTPKKQSGLPVWAIVLIVVGAVLILAGAGLLIWQRA